MCLSSQASLHRHGWPSKTYFEDRSSRENWKWEKCDSKHHPWGRSLFIWRPHAILLVMPLGRYTQEDQNTVALIKGVFGESAMKHMIVLFTRREELEDQTLDDFIATADVSLKSVIQECGGRCYAISNRADKAEKEGQVQELVDMIEKMSRENPCGYFNENIYKDIEKRLNKQADILQKKYDEQLKNEIKLIENDCSLKTKEEISKRIVEARIRYDEKKKDRNEEDEQNTFDYIFCWVKNALWKIWHTFWK
uniref:AIG1-type G domain-containing protein n=1 Tax=Oryctolagus cuniculus TaxID=9986 RepID=G1TIT2_RABIT